MAKGQNLTRDSAHQKSYISSAAANAKLIGPKTLSTRKQSVAGLNSGVKTHRSGNSQIGG